MADWVQAEYGIDRERFVRPFYPGGDYQSFDYSGGAVVVDNPPFSIYKQILDFFEERRIPFFLFAPEKTMLKDRRDVCFVSVSQKFEYDGKVSVSTGFVTNLEAGCLRNAPTLYSAIEAADKGRRPEKLPKRKLPRELLTVSMLDMMTRNGIGFKLAPEDARFVRRLDCGLDIYGAGYLLSASAAARLEAARLEAARLEAARLEAARLEAAEVIELSEREKVICEKLG